MRSFFPLLAVAALAACGSNQTGFDKYPVGSGTAAIEARDAERAAAVTREAAPFYEFTSREMRRSDAPVSQNEAATRSIAERKSRNGVSLDAGGQSFTVTQVNYDGYDFLVAHGGGTGSVDQSEAIKGMTDTVSPCAPSGPAWREGGSYAIALSCL